MKKQIVTYPAVFKPIEIKMFILLASQMFQMQLQKDMV